MSDNPYLLQTQPTNLDLHKEQSRQGAKLETISDDILEIKHCLLGESDKKPGLVVDVDRLKRSRLFHNAIAWFGLTTFVGTGTALFIVYFN